MDHAEIKSRGRQLQQQFMSIARDLDTHGSNVKTAKIVGTTASILGTGLAIGATILTGGLALPAVAVIGGLGAGAAGAATAVGAELVGKAITRSKLDDAQRAWDRFTEALPKSHKLPFNKDAALSEVMQVIKGGGGLMSLAGAFGVAGSAVGSLVPVVGGIFAGISAFDLLVTMASDEDERPGTLLRNFINNILIPFLNKL